MAKPKLPDTIRVKVMDLLDEGYSEPEIGTMIRNQTDLPDDELKMCISAIRRHHDKGRRPRVRSTNRDGKIYFIQGEETKNIKIGFSVDPEDRLRQHQTSSSEKLNMLKSIKASQDLEAEIHRRFQYCRLHGEWFGPDKKLLEYIDKL